MKCRMVPQKLMENLWKTRFDKKKKKKKKALCRFTKSLNLIMREGGNINALKALHVRTSVQLWTPNGSD